MNINFTTQLRVECARHVSCDQGVVKWYFPKMVFYDSLVETIHDHSYLQTREKNKVALQSRRQPKWEVQQAGIFLLLNKFLLHDVVAVSCRWLL